MTACRHCAGPILEEGQRCPAASAQFSDLGKGDGLCAPITPAPAAAIWEMCDTDDPGMQQRLMGEGWEPFAVVAVPAAGGGTASVVYFRRKVG